MSIVFACCYPILYRKRLETLCLVAGFFSVTFCIACKCLLPSLLCFCGIQACITVTDGYLWYWSCSAFSSYPHFISAHIYLIHSCNFLFVFPTQVFEKKFSSSSSTLKTTINQFHSILLFSISLCRAILLFNCINVYLEQKVEGKVDDYLCLLFFFFFSYISWVSELFCRLCLYSQMCVNGH